MQVSAAQQQSQGKEGGEYCTVVDNRQNSMHCTTRQVTPHQSERRTWRVVSPILGAILGCGQGLMKPNLGGIRYRRAEGSLVLQAGLAWSSRWPSNRPPANGQYGMLTGTIARTGLADTEGHGTWPNSVRRDAKRGRVPLSLSIGRKACDGLGIVLMSWKCAAGPRGKTLTSQNLPEPGKLWPGSVSNADQ